MTYQKATNDFQEPLSLNLEISDSPQMASGQSKCFPDTGAGDAHRQQITDRSTRSGNKLLDSYLRLTSRKHPCPSRLIYPYPCIITSSR